MECVRHDEHWVTLLAQELVADVTEWMAGISLVFESPPRQPTDRMDAVYGSVEGELEIRMRFSAEPRLVHRLAERILGRAPETEEETREYATEFVNVLCGRFISELCRDGRHSKMRFHTPRYEVSPHITPLPEEGVQTVSFISDEQEQVVFSWVINAGGGSEK